MLDQHPEISMAKPIRPEPKFFLDAEAGKGGRDRYLEKYFPENVSTLIGEKSTSYLESTEAGERIKLFFPDAKILILLRDPVERAISNYFFSVKNGLETRSIEDVFINKLAPPDIEKSVSVSPFDYLSRGKYYGYIKRYYKIFPKENIHVLVNERITTDRAELAALYSILGVDDSYVAVDFEAMLNTSYETKFIPDGVREKIQHYYDGDINSLSRYVDVNCWGQNV
jgi:hypothetical protein